MLRSGLVLVGVATVFAAVDLAHKALVLADRGERVLYDDRSSLYLFGIAVGSLAWALALVATRSRLLAAAGGVLLGGAAGNALSLVLWPAYEGVPNPLFAGDETLGLAFNLADVFVIAAGFVVIPTATLLFAVRNRDRLGERVRLNG